MNDRPAFLFDRDLCTLIALAGLDLADTARIIPCAWHGLTLDHLQQSMVTVVTHRANAMLPSAGAHTLAHYMSIADLQLPRAHKYMALQVPSEWKHYAGDKLDTDAAYTYRTYNAMRPKRRADLRE